jgi:ABC-type glutathione transport system ATPase component
VAGVFSRPRTAYTASLLASSLRLGGTPGGAHAPAASTAAAAAEPPFLALRGLSFAYRRASWFASARSTAAPTLAEIDLSVGRGEILGVIGESGSGKTTLGGIVAGLLAPTRGAATFDGRPLAGLAAQRPADVRRRIQIVFQDALSSLNPRHTVGASIARPLQLWFGLDRRAARTRAAALLGELGMGAAFLDRFPRQLSGGQQQRVAIARAFAAEPELLICDEITSALDASVQSQVLQQLAMLQERTGTAMIVITHDLAVVWRMAARVVVLQAGRVVEQGETERVFRHPTNPYTAALLHAAGRAERIAAQAPPPVAVA